MMASGVSMTLVEYTNLSAINRDDIVLWREAEVQRANDENELNTMNASRN